MNIAMQVSGWPVIYNRLQFGTIKAGPPTVWPLDEGTFEVMPQEVGGNVSIPLGYRLGYWHLLFAFT
jgi:hypothetical protein